MRWLWLTFLVVVLDHLTKFYASQHLTFNLPEVITPWLNFSLAHNYGAAFSWLGDAGGWQRWFFVALAAIVSIVLLIWILRLPKKSQWLPCTLSLILGGAVGNLIDRIWFGYVVDFIDFHIGSWHFATFNVADIAISIGAVMMLIDAFFLADSDSK